jgi:hypothetical protein
LASYDSVQCCCISLTIAFALDDFESLLQNFGVAWTSSKFGDFRLGDGER